jgi:hypothetical protein
MRELDGRPDPAPSLGEFGSRTAVRLAVLGAFAAASSQPFWPVLANLLLVGAGLASVMAVGRREPLLGRTLTHWDEAALYALLGLGLSLAHRAAAAAA